MHDHFGDLKNVCDVTRVGCLRELSVNMVVWQRGRELGGLVASTVNTVLK